MSPEAAERWLCRVLVSLTVLLCLVRFAFLKADFPNHSPWMMDQSKFTDEGWWASGAVRHFLVGHWQVAGDYNPATAAPVWPLLLTVVFHFTGVTLQAVRAVSVLCSVATVWLVYLLVKRYGGGSTAASFAAVLVAASPFAYAFGRLATLDTVTVFEFCLLLLVASFASSTLVWPLVALGLLIPILVLTKTTAAVLLPAVLWLLWAATARSPRRFLPAVLWVAAIASTVMGCYLSLLLRSHFAGDYRYFFEINALPDVIWALTPSYVLQLLQHGLWVDRILCPAALAALVLSVVWLRVLWTNPLFAAAWIALAGQVTYILRRQDDYAPRYFLAMLVPVILIVVLSLQELRVRTRGSAWVPATVLIAAMSLDMAQVVGFLRHRQYQFYDAAQSIQRIVDGDRSAHRLLLGASGDQLSLMAGVPAINDFYSNQELSQKVLFYRPGWYVGWNELDQDVLASLSAFRLDKVATYHVFDNEQRNELSLYRLALTKPAP